MKLSISLLTCSLPFTLHAENLRIDSTPATGGPGQFAASEIGRDAAGSDTKARSGAAERNSQPERLIPEGRSIAGAPPKNGPASLRF